MEGFLQFCIDYGYVGMLLSAFIAGSVLPFSSEVVLVSLMGVGLNPWLLLIFATVGNVFGGMTCYGVGRLGKTSWIEKVFHISPRRMEQAQKYVQGWGAWTAFLSFVPLIGSAVVISLGLMRSNLFITILSMSLGKILRYAIVIFSAQGIVYLM